jgi:peptidoglycan/LPS O-acetylase OafA/YrhL
MQHPKFRQDVQGLRGVAVLLVVIYHAELGWIKAGYLGVDIFFVISGFLIAGLIASQIADEAFSFREF